MEVTVMANNHRAFLLTVQTEYDIRRIRAVAGFDTEDGFRTPVFSPFDVDSYLTDFEVTAYLERGRPQAWGASHQFAPHRVDLPRAEVMARMLRRVERGMGKAAQLFGYPGTFHAYLSHVAYALGIKRFLVGPDEGGRFGNGARYLTHDAASIASWIYRQEQTHGRPAA
jgi:hypothetical protein